METGGNQLLARFHKNQNGNPTPPGCRFGLSDVRYALACRDATNQALNFYEPLNFAAWLVASRQAKAYRTIMAVAANYSLAHLAPPCVAQPNR